VASPLLLEEKVRFNKNHATSIADINGLLTYHRRPQSKSGGQLLCFSRPCWTNKNENFQKEEGCLNLQKTSIRFWILATANIFWLDEWTGAYLRMLNRLQWFVSTLWGWVNGKLSSELHQHIHTYTSTLNSTWHGRSHPRAAILLSWEWRSAVPDCSRFT
jgi:hypothetical protein